MIKAVFFDLDDTLCDDTAAWLHCAHAAASLGAERLSGVNADRLAEAFLRISETYWTSLDYFSESRTMLALRTAQFRQALVEIGASSDAELAEEMAHLYGSMRSTEINLFPDAMTTVDTLRSRGIKLACITNGLAVTHEEKVAHLGIDVAFDHVLIAGVVGHYKPDVRIFERALDLCDCTSAEAVMVGDDLTRDIGGAQSAGIRAYWFNPQGRTRAQDDPMPEAELSTLSALLDRTELFD